MAYNSRRNEFAADQYALNLGMGDALGRGLVKISTGDTDFLSHFHFTLYYRFSSNRDVVRCVK
jgi:Zn-dependent protease with chaperone function